MILLSNDVDLTQYSASNTWSQFSGFSAASGRFIITSEQSIVSEDLHW